MQKSKRILSIITCTALISTLVTGCGGTNSDSQSESGTAPTTNGESADSASVDSGKKYEGVTIRWQYHPAGVKEEQDAWNQSIIDEFHEETGATVIPEMVSWEDAQTKTMAAVAAGTGPDVCQIVEQWAGQVFSSDSFYALDEYMDSKFDGKDAYVPAALDYGIYDGTIYALPWGGDTRLYYTRQSTLDKAGITIPENWTWDEFVDCMLKLKEVGYDTPFATIGQNSFDTFFYYFYTMIGHGGSLLSEDGKTATINTEAGKQTLTDIVDLINKYQVMSPTIAEYDEDTITAAFINDDVQVVPLSSGQITVVQDSGIDDIVAILPPTGNDGTYGGMLAISLIGVPTYTKNKDCALDFLAKLMSRDWQVSYNNMCGWMPARPDAIEDEVFNNQWRSTLGEGMTKGSPLLPRGTHTAAITSIFTAELGNLYAKIAQGSFKDDDIETTLSKIETQVQAELDK